MWSPANKFAPQTVLRDRLHVNAASRWWCKTTAMKAAIICAPLDLGAGRRGVDMGPSAIRYAGLEERLRALGVHALARATVAPAVAEATAEHDERARFLPAIRRTCERISELVGAALDE